jgi:hypothetical protein
MTAIDFPNSPTVGDSFTVGNRIWTWDGSVWESDNARTFVRTVSDSAPTEPFIGDEWFNSATGRLYTYYDSYWVEIGTSVSGQNGADGDDGADGEDGASAYDIAVANGFVGTEQEWLATLVSTGKAIAMAIVFG